MLQNFCLGASSAPQFEQILLPLIVAPQFGQKRCPFSTNSPQEKHLSLFKTSIEAPHSAQNFFPSSTAAPQLGHVFIFFCSMFAPQLGQNFIPRTTSLPQLGHFICEESRRSKETLRRIEEPPDIMNFSMHSKISAGNLFCLYAPTAEVIANGAKTKIPTAAAPALSAHLP